jgi:hypothetical protein
MHQLASNVADVSVSVPHLLWDVIPANAALFATG